MGWITGPEIKKQVEQDRITIYPFNNESINPNSYNYKLDPRILRATDEILDVKVQYGFEEIIIPEEGFVIQPGELYLGATVEKFGSRHYASLVTGRSSVGRYGVTNHITAALIDIGFFGSITLEITCVKPTRIYPNMNFGQIYWFEAIGEKKQYDGKYQEQEDAQISRLYLDFKTIIGQKP